jgi:hypothetical protein
MPSGYFETVERGHDRTETRRYWTLGELGGVGQARRWKGLNVIGRGQSIREQDGRTSKEYRYDIGSIGSIGNDAQRFAAAVRGYWGVENDLHWSLDIAFREIESPPEVAFFTLNGTWLGLY